MFEPKIVILVEDGAVCDIKASSLVNVTVIDDDNQRSENHPVEIDVDYVENNFVQ